MKSISQTAPAIYTDKARQLRGLISFHERAAKAYRQAGKIKQASEAETKRAECQAELNKLTEGTNSHE